jgi:signal transduction histidine kinase
MGGRESMPNTAGKERDPVIETIAIFSDRLRTPLTAIWAQVAMLLDGDHGSLSAEQRNALEVVQRNSTRLLQVIEDAEQSLARSIENPEGHRPPPSRESTPIPTRSTR